MTSDAYQKNNVAIDNGRIAFISYADSISTPKLFNITTKTTVELTDTIAANFVIGISGNNVIWANENGLYVYDIAEAKNYLIRSSGYFMNATSDENPSINGDIVAWAEDHTNIYYYDLSTDTDDDGIPNYKETEVPNPDVSLHLLPVEAQSVMGVQVSGQKISYMRLVDDVPGRVYLYDIADGKEYSIIGDDEYSYVDFVGNNIVAGRMFTRKISVYDLATDTDNDGTPNYKEEPALTPDPALTAYTVGSDIGGGGAIKGLDIYNGSIYYIGTDGITNGSSLFSYNMSSGVTKKLVTSGADGSGVSASNLGEGIVALIASKDSNRDNDVYYSSLNYDTDEPYFTNLPGTSTKINFTEGQIVQRAEITVKVRPEDDTTSIAKVVFSIDGGDLGEDETADSQGVFSASIPILRNKLGGVTLRARAFDKSYNYKDYEINIVPDPMLLPYLSTTKAAGNPEGSQDGYYVPSFDGQYIYAHQWGRSFYKASEGGTFSLYADSLGNLSRDAVNQDYVCHTTRTSPAILKCKDIDASLFNELEIASSATDGSFGTYNNLVLRGSEIYWYQAKSGSTKVYKRNLDLGLAGQNELLYSSSLDSIWRIVPISGAVYVMQDDLDGSGFIKKIDGQGVTTTIYRSDNGIIDMWASENYTVAQIERGSVTEFYSIENNTGDATLIRSTSASVWDLYSTDNYAVWVEAPSGANGNSIYAYDLKHERLINIFASTYSAENSGWSNADNPFIYGDKIFWSGNYGDGVDEIYETELVFEDIVPPAITKVSGLEGTTGESATVTVTATDNVKTAMAKISVRGAAYVNMTGTSSPFTYTVPIPEDSGNKIPISIKVYDVAGNNTSGSYNITVADNDTPFVASIEGNTVTTGETTLVKVKALDNIQISKAEISIDGSSYALMTLNDGYYTYSYTAPTDKAGNLNLKIRVTDSSNKVFEKSDAIMVVTDNDPPTITRVTNTDISGDEGGRIMAYATDNIAPVKGMITFDNVLWEDMSGTSSPFSYVISNSKLNGKNKLTYYVRVYDAAGNYDTTEPNSAPVVNTTTNKESQSTIQKALTLVQGVIENVVKNTPTPVAKSFPYILFAALLASAYVFTVQARREAEQASKKLEMVQFRKVIADEKSNFVILVSHYLRTPLTLISSGIDEMLKGQKGEKAEKIRKANTHLGAVIQQIVTDIEKDTAIGKIKNPNLRTEGIRAYTSPFIIIPALAIAGLVVYANYLFRNVADIDLGTVNLITQGVVFVVAIQVFAYYLRKKQNQHNNLKYFNQTIEYQVAVDEARTELLVNAKQKVNAAVADLRHDLGKRGNEYITEGLSRMDVILTKMGYLANLKYEDIQKSKSSANLQDMAEKILAKKKAEITEKKLKVRVSLGTLKTHDSQKIVLEIISEIIDNAIKFSPKSGVVVIKGDTKDGLSRIVVSDQGRGISKREQLYIFKPFSRTSSALNFEHEGIGLGLYYARSLSNMLGGDVYIKSAPEKGTEVTVVL